MLEVLGLYTHVNVFKKPLHEGYDPSLGPEDDEWWLRLVSRLFELKQVEKLEMHTLFIRPLGQDGPTICEDVLKAMKGVVSGKS